MVAGKIYPKEFSWPGTRIGVIKSYKEFFDLLAKDDSDECSGEKKEKRVELWTLFEDD